MLAAVLAAVPAAGGRHPGGGLTLTGRERGSAMLGWIMMLIGLATVAGLLGFGGIYPTATGVAQWLFALFLVLIVVSIAFAALRRR